MFLKSAEVGSTVRSQSRHINSWPIHSGIGTDKFNRLIDQHWLLGHCGPALQTREGSKIRHGLLLPCSKTVKESLFCACHSWSFFAALGFVLRERWERDSWKIKATARKMLLKKMGTERIADVLLKVNRFLPSGWNLNATDRPPPIQHAISEHGWRALRNGGEPAVHQGTRWRDLRCLPAWSCISSRMPGLK